MGVSRVVLVQHHSEKLAENTYAKYKKFTAATTANENTRMCFLVMIVSMTGCQL